MSRLLRLALLLALAAPSAALAAEANVRLVVAGVAAGKVSAGIAVDLPEGWKTYWRTPGDAGIPPTFDAAASTGLTPVTVRYPVPERFDEAGLTAIGYTKSVVLPIDTALADPAKPGKLVVEVMIGICHEICLPFETRLEATIDPKTAPDAAAAAVISAAMARVPVAADTTKPPRIVSARRDTSGRQETVVVEVAMPPAGGDEDVLVEGPTAEWALPLPRRDATGRRGHANGGPSPSTACRRAPRSARSTCVSRCDRVRAPSNRWCGWTAVGSRPRSNASSCPSNQETTP